MWQTLLIANRGEIACRIIRTAKALGIECIAIYSEADKHALHVQLADRAYYVGPSPSQDSYLNSKKIISIAKKAGAQAIHPGYGFLSENLAFADACQQANITFIGPPAAAIAAMGAKDAAKALMDKAGVPTVPGYHDANQDAKHLQAQAEKIGYPVLLKAAAGGGGKGMRVVNNSQQFSAALDSAKREAKASFDNDHMIIEKYLANARHIEIQIFTDQQGQGVYLFERDCSLQRRQQKIIEEAPASHFSQDLRQAMGETAVKAALAIDYDGAGTIEFLLSDDNQFYFMEMNTRLQVEHPITEMITGVDLVEWQIRIAQGEALPLTQSQLQIKGHAIEARIYAEDPQQDFMPSIGKIHALSWPNTSKHCRIDTGVQSGDQISMYYDPMIAKLIVWANTRELAIKHCQQALQASLIAGITSNIDFLQALLKSDAFNSGHYSTQTIEQQQTQLLTASQGTVTQALAMAAIYLCKPNTKANNPWQQNDAWRMNLPAQQHIELANQAPMSVEFDNSYTYITLDAQKMMVENIVFNTDKEFLTITADIDHQHHRANVYQHDKTLWVFTDTAHRFHLIDQQQQYAHLDSSGGHLNAPMPGTVVAILTETGSEVESGTGLMVIEAMKMEHTIHAPSAGLVKSIHYKVGDQVNEGDELLAFETQG